jgi:hypothetical protein
MTPRSPRTKPEKIENSEDLVRKLPNLVGQGASSNPKRTDDKGPHAVGGDSRRLGKQHRPKEAAGWAEVGLGRPAQATSRPSQPPFDLAAIQPIYSPEARRHISTHSPSAAEEQRREGQHLGEERVELVD